MGMKWCEKCGGPVWRDPRSYEQGWNCIHGCRLCWLEEVSGVRRFGSGQWGERVADANSTDNSPATSTWLPPGARESVQVHAVNPATALQMWLRDRSMWEREEPWVDLIDRARRLLCGDVEQAVRIMLP